MLFVKSPPPYDEKKMKQEKITYMMKNAVGEEKKLREHIQKLLLEAETLRGLEMIIND